MSEPQRFAMVMPIPDSVADDPELFAILEEHARTNEWADAVRKAGGRLHESPVEVERIPNPRYLSVIGVDEETGEDIIDHTKFTLYFKGWAVRNGD